MTIGEILDQTWVQVKKQETKMNLPECMMAYNQIFRPLHRNVWWRIFMMMRDGIALQIRRKINDQR